MIFDYVATVVDVVDANDVEVIFDGLVLLVVVVFSMSPLFLIFMSISSSPDVSGSGTNGGGEKDESDDAGFPIDVEDDDDDPPADDDSPEDDDDDAGSLI